MIMLILHRSTIGYKDEKNIEENAIHQDYNLGAVLLDFPTDAKELWSKLVKQSDARVWKIRCNHD